MNILTSMTVWSLSWADSKLLYLASGLLVGFWFRFYSVVVVAAAQMPRASGPASATPTLLVELRVDIST